MASISMRFIGALDQVTAAREWVGERLREAGIPAREVDAVQLAVSEAATNVMRHAYEGKYPAAFELDLRVDAERITVLLRDEGRPFAPDGVGAPDPEALAESGYGLFLIESLMDEVTYTPGAAGTELRLSKRRRST
jgi:serine/threonine-protein kinase RsbW